MRKIFLALFMFYALSINCYAAYEWRAGTGANTILGTTKINDIDSVSYQNIVAPIDRIMANYREDAKIVYATAATLTVNAGEIVCSNSGATIRKFRKNDSATTVTWANIDTGSEAASTTYYVYALADADSENFTVSITLSAVAPTGATYYKRLGSFYNNSSSNITLINNDNDTDEFGALVSKSDSTAYQAATDGFFIGTLVAGSSTSASRIIVYSDGASSPTTVVDGCHVWVNTGSAAESAQLNYCGFSVPVKKGDYYKGVLSTYSGTNAGTATYYWMPKQ